MTVPRRPLRGKKLLVAALGVGALKLTGCILGNPAFPPDVPGPPCDDAGNYSCEDLSMPASDLGPGDGGTRD